MTEDKLLGMWLVACTLNHWKRGTDGAHGQKANTLLSTAIAVLGNTLLGMSQRRCHATWYISTDDTNLWATGRRCPLSTNFLAVISRRPSKRLMAWQSCLSRSIRPPAGAFFPTRRTNGGQSHGSNSQLSSNHSSNYRGRPAPFKGRSRQSSTTSRELSVCPSRLKLSRAKRPANVTGRTNLFYDNWYTSTHDPFVLTMVRGH